MGIFDWYSRLLGGQPQPEDQGQGLMVQPNRQTGAWEPYQPAQQHAAALDQLYKMAGGEAFGDAYSSYQHGDYLPALGQAAVGATQAAALAVPSFRAGGAAARAAAPLAREAGAAFPGLLADEAGALRLTPAMRKRSEITLGTPLPEVEPLAAEDAAVYGTYGRNSPPPARRSAPPSETPLYPQYAEQYPETTVPEVKWDKKKEDWYLAKRLTPEAREFQRERQRIADDMAANGYTPYFDPAQRYHVDPQNYPANTDTTAIIPKGQATIDKHMATIGSDESRARLQEAYKLGSEMPNTGHWYAMGQMEQKFIDALGEDEGRKAFRDKFATSMAATTGGADPTSNLLMAQYGNYLRANNLPYPEHGYEMPFPVGGRFAGSNMAMHQKMFDEGGFSSLGALNPKRHNFALDFLGHPEAATMDEQMTSGMTPGKQMPPAGTYGLYERTLAEEAAKAGVDPRFFQETAWGGFKRMKDPTYTSGKPMIEEVNDMIERTHRLTGMPRDEIFRRGFIEGKIPMYGLLGGVSLEGADQYSR